MEREIDLQRRQQAVELLKQSNTRILKVKELQEGQVPASFSKIRYIKVEPVRPEPVKEFDTQGFYQRAGSRDFTQIQRNKGVIAERGIPELNMLSLPEVSTGAFFGKPKTPATSQGDGQQRSLQLAVLSQQRATSAHREVKQAKIDRDVAQVASDLIMTETELFPPEMCSMHTAQSARVLMRGR